MPQIIIQCSTSTEWSSALVRRILHSDFSHMDWVRHDGLFGASDPGGVRLRPFNYQPFLYRHNAILEVTAEQCAAFTEFMLSQDGKPFDKEGLWSFLGEPRPTPWHDRGQWICSELIAAAMDVAKIFKRRLIVRKDRISPPDLLLRINDYIDVDEFERPLSLTWGGYGPS